MSDYHTPRSGSPMQPDRAHFDVFSDAAQPSIPPMHSNYSDNRADENMVSRYIDDHQTEISISPGNSVMSKGGSLITFDFQTSPSSSSPFKSLHEKLSSPERKKLTPAEARQKLDDRQLLASSNRSKNVSEIKEKVG